MKISRFHLKLQTGIDLTQMYQSAVLDRQLGIIFNLLLHAPFNRKMRAQFSMAKCTPPEKSWNCTKVHNNPNFLFLFCSIFKNKNMCF